MAFNPYEKENEAIVEYQDRTPLNEQYQICLEYLRDRKLFDEFEEWRDEKGPHEYLPDVREFCEAHKGFWDWVVDCNSYEGPDSLEELHGER